MPAEVVLLYFVLELIPWFSFGSSCSCSLSAYDYFAQHERSMDYEWSTFWGGLQPTAAVFCSLSCHGRDEHGNTDVLVRQESCNEA